MNSIQHIQRKWTLESVFLGLLGAALVYLSLTVHPHLSIIQETIVLVIFLGALLGVAPIPFPNLKHRLWLYPIVAGLISAFMDSFLVLLMVAAIPIIGHKSQELKFKAYVMIAALIGGLLVYFGEVYALPHYLKYGMSNIYDGLPLLVPVLMFLGVLGYLTQRLTITVTSKESTINEGLDHVNDLQSSSNFLQTKRRWENFVEFAIGIAIVLIAHDPILALGALFLYAAISGQGEDLLHVMKTETEMGVMLLLLSVWILSGPVQGLVSSLDGFSFLWLSMINAVFFGALLPGNGDVWREISLISAGAIFLPISSLVGVMIFKSMREWWAYVKLSAPLMVLWLILSLGWFTYVWPSLEPTFFSIFNIEGYELVDTTHVDTDSGADVQH